MNSFKLFGQELLQLIEGVAREKNISKEKMLEAIEYSIAEAGKEKYGNEYDISVEIDHKTGNFKIKKNLTVTDVVTDSFKQISLDDAIKNNPSILIGDVISEELPIFSFGRSAAIIARKTLNFKIKEAEKFKQYEEFKNRLGDIVSGAVKRAEFNNIVVDIGGRAEALLKKEFMIQNENYRIGDKVTAYIYDVKYDLKGYQIFLSRTHNEFLAKLFEQEVPEIYDKIIKIMGVARDCGSHAKVAVHCKDPNLDPVGTCVGIRGSRVQPIVHELQGEKIDIVIWSDNTATYVANALSPAVVQRVTVDTSRNIFEVVVPNDQLSIAIGRRGQNVKLASKLTGVSIDVMSEEKDSEKRTKEFHAISNMFVDALNCDEVIANLLAVEGFLSVDDIVNEKISTLAKIEGFDEEIASEILNRALDYISKREELRNDKLNGLGIDPKIKQINLLSYEMIVCLSDNGIKEIEQLRELSSDELLDILKIFGLKREDAESIIMKAREGWEI